MAAIAKTPSGTWKAIIRKRGWPTAIQTFRTKRDAQGWSWRTEDEMVRGIYIHRALSERTSIQSALKRYLSEVTPTKKPSTQRAEVTKSKTIIERLGAYGLAALTPDIVAEYRDERLAEGKSNNTVRLERLAGCFTDYQDSGLYRITR
jgi:hypothetical protein